MIMGLLALTFFSASSQAVIPKYARCIATAGNELAVQICRLKAIDDTYCEVWKGFC